MHLDSVRELKAELIGSPAAAAARGAPLTAFADLVMSAGAARRAQQTRTADPLPRTVALGVARRGRRDYRLAVRVQRRSVLTTGYIEILRRRARSEVDVRYVGYVGKLKAARPPAQTRQRPLRIGLSIGHYAITAGTLGAFVRRRDSGEPRILSNNHVLANENRARRDDPVLQPGAYDGGRIPRDRVGGLAEFVRLSKSRVNYVDCALATIDAPVRFTPDAIRGHGKLRGVLADPVDVDEIVAKLGRTTGFTRGRVTAFELDNVVVGYDAGNLRFDDQIEIEGADSGPFSDGGDSGSVIFTATGHQAVALLFAGGDTGGSNGAGLTYANPIATVLGRLRAELLL